MFAAREGAKSGSYVVTLDADLLEHIDTARRLQQGLGRGQIRSRDPHARAESALTPREIQARLRAGRTVDEVADEAGVPVDWVDRFAAPILAERARAVDRAGRLKLRTSRRRESDRPLRAAVARNLADRGVHMLDTEMDAAWSAYQLAGAEWVVRLQVRHEGHDLQAEWTLDMSTNALVPRDRLAADLGFVDTDRHSPTAPPPARSLSPVVATGAGVQGQRPPAASGRANRVTAVPAGPAAAPAATSDASVPAGGGAESVAVPMPPCRRAGGLSLLRPCRRVGGRSLRPLPTSRCWRAGGRRPRPLPMSRCRRAGGRSLLRYLTPSCRRRGGRRAPGCLGDRHRHRGAGSAAHGRFAAVRRPPAVEAAAGCAAGRHR